MSVSSPLTPITLAPNFSLLSSSFARSWLSGSQPGSFGVKVRALVRDPSKGKKLLADVSTLSPFFRAVLTITKAQLATSSSTVPRMRICLLLSPLSRSPFLLLLPLPLLSVYLFIHPYIYMSIYQSPSLSLSPSLPPPSFLPSPRKYSPLLSPIFPNIHACATAHREKRCWAG